MNWTAISRHAFRLAAGLAAALTASWLLRQANLNRFTAADTEGINSLISLIGSIYAVATSLGDANYAEAYCNLGNLLQQGGKLTEALALYKQGHALGLKKPGWRYPSAAWVRNAERLVRLEKNLPAVLSGLERPARQATA